jgi:hypothetical protein
MAAVIVHTDLTFVATRCIGATQEYEHPDGLDLLKPDADVRLADGPDGPGPAPSREEEVADCGTTPLGYRIRLTYRDQVIFIKHGFAEQFGDEGISLTPGSGDDHAPFSLTYLLDDGDQELYRSLLLPSLPCQLYGNFNIRSLPCKSISSMSPHVPYPVRRVH